MNFCLGILVGIFGGMLLSGFMAIMKVREEMKEREEAFKKKYEG